MCEWLGWAIMEVYTMRKLMCVAAAMTAGICLADVQSANIVGYQNVAVVYGKNLITPTFKNMNDANQEFYLSDIRVMNDKGEEFGTTATTRCNGTVTIQKLEAGYFTKTYYFYKTSTMDGWYDGDKKKVQGNAVKFLKGEAMLVNNGWKTDKTVHFRVAGEVDLVNKNMIPYGKSIVGNATPVATDLSKIRVLNDKAVEFGTTATTRCNGTVTIQKLEAGYFTKTYYFYKTSTMDGWYDGDKKKVSSGAIPLEPGESFLINNGWKTDKVVYLQLPDPTAAKAE